jgi:predicted regulator of Ras-like GTPase activity (Roadblock/LC7/MglB family)
LKIPTMMFKFLKRMFGRDGVAAATTTPGAVPAAAIPVPRAVEKPVGGGVEVASLSLRAILEKLPPELRAIVNQMPDPGVKIVLPVNTIMKQLATGAVKMSLASLLRQAPQGTFRKTAIEEKQMLDVPLAEVFKCVDASKLGRRSDQRRYDVPDDAAGLFGTNGSMRSVTAAASTAAEVPRSEIPKPSASAPQPVQQPVPAPVPQVEAPKVVRMPGIAPAAPSPTNGNGNGHATPVPESVPKPQVPASAPKPRAVAPSVSNGELVISFVELASFWPEGIRSALSLLPGDTKFVIPAGAVSAGLQKGRVAFPWSQVRMWLKPGLSATTAIPEDFELVFPLKIMAPAFVAATGATKRREAAEIDHSLPDFFGPSAGQKAKPEAPAPAPAPTAETVPPIVAAPTEIAAEIAPPAPEPAAAPLKFTLVREEPTPIVEAAPVVPIEVPVAEAPATEAPVAQPVTAPLAEIASSPAEIVGNACDLPGVAGAVVALEEGLVVAQKLPPAFSADTFAAFMPQIFGRLEKYTAEIQLGAASEITIQTAQGPWYIARRGKIYFGILGRAGERLPDSLGNLANQLAAHNS